MSSDVIPMLVQTAQRYGIDPNTFVAISHVETGGTFKPSAQNPKSSAGGLFQFTNKTWNEYGQGQV